jgi:hypothetical protein
MPDPAFGRLVPWSLVDGLRQELEPNGHPATPWQCQSDKEWGHNSNHHRLLGSDLCPASVDGPESLSAAWERSRACGAQHGALRQVCAWWVRAQGGAAPSLCPQLTG